MTTCSWYVLCVLYVFHARHKHVQALKTIFPPQTIENIYLPVYMVNELHLYDAFLHKQDKALDNTSHSPIHIQQGCRVRRWPISGCSVLLKDTLTCGRAGGAKDNPLYRPGAKWLISFSVVLQHTVQQQKNIRKACFWGSKDACVAT